MRTCVVAWEKHFLAGCCCSGCRQINNQLCTACHQGSLSSCLFLLPLDSIHLLPKQHQFHWCLTFQLLSPKQCNLWFNFTIPSLKRLRSYNVLQQEKLFLSQFAYFGDQDDKKKKRKLNDEEPIFICSSNNLKPGLEHSFGDFCTICFPFCFNICTWMMWCTVQSMILYYFFTRRFNKMQKEKKKKTASKNKIKL